MFYEVNDDNLNMMAICLPYVSIVVYSPFTFVVMMLCFLVEMKSHVIPHIQNDDVCLCDDI